MKANIIKALRNTAETIEIEAGRSARRNFPGVNFDNAALIINGKIAEPDTIIKNGDIVTLRLIPADLTDTPWWVATFFIPFGFIIQPVQLAIKARKEAERAEAELEVAKLEAQKKIEEARGNAEAQKIIAQASAEAATYNIVELAKTVGYTVNETYLYSVEGVEREFAAKQAESETTIYLGTKYVIDLTSGPGQDQFKVLVEDYLKYLAYLEKWNGELPDVVSGDDALSIIVPNS